MYANGIEDSEAFLWRLTLCNCIFLKKTFILLSSCFKWPPFVRIIVNTVNANFCNV